MSRYRKHHHKKMRDYQADESVLKMPINFADRAIRRVIAPHVSIIRKGWKPKARRLKESNVQIFLKTKSAFMVKTVSQFLLDKVELQTLVSDTAECLKTVTDARGKYRNIP